MFTDREYIEKPGDGLAKIFLGVYCILAAFFMTFTFFFALDLVELFEKNQTEVEKEKKLQG